MSNINFLLKSVIILIVSLITPYDCLASPAAARISSGNGSRLAHGFQIGCMREYVVCKYVNFDFTNHYSVRQHVVIYLPILSNKEVMNWNEKQERFVQKHGHKSDKNMSFKISILAYGGSQWSAVAVDTKCRYCVMSGKWGLRAGRHYWIKFDSVSIDTTRPKHSIWDFVEMVRKYEPLRFLIEVESEHGQNVYASIRNNGFHHMKSTMKNGYFHSVLIGKAVPSDRPSYIVVSLIPSWHAFGAKYNMAENAAVADSSELPRFKGKTKEIVGLAIKYMISLHIKYSLRHAGVLPSENVSTILSSRLADCEGFVTLLHALLLKSGVAADPVILNSKGLPPLSFSVPGPWADHVIIYIPSLDKFVDITAALTYHGTVPGSSMKFTWKNSDNLMIGFVGFNTVTKNFVTVH